MKEVRDLLSRLGHPRVALPLLAALAAVLRLPRLGESLWFDEVLYSTHQAWSTWPALLRSFLTDPSAPLYRLLLFGWVELFGEGEIAVRLPSLLCGIGSILLLHGLVRRASGDGPALLAGVMLCFSPPHVWYSQEATAYALTLLLLVAAVSAADRLVREPFSAARGWLFALALLGAVFAHFFVAALLLPLGFLAATARGRARRWMLAVIGATGLAVGAALLVKQFAGHLATGQPFLRAFTPIEAWMFYLHWLPAGNVFWGVRPGTATWQFVVGHPVLLAGQLALGLLLLRGLLAGEDRSRRARWLDAAWIGTLPLALAVLGLAGWRHLYIERYLLVVLPFFAALLARGAWSLRSLSLRRLAVAGLVALGVASWIAWYRQPEQWTVYKPNPDWRTAVSLLVERTPPNRRAMVVGTAPLEDLAFYLRRLGAAPRIELVRTPGWRPGQGRLLPGVRTVHLIFNRAWSADFDRVHARMDADPALRQVGHAAADGVEIFTYRRIREPPEDPRRRRPRSINFGS